MNEARFTVEEVVQATGGGHRPGPSAGSCAAVATDTRTLRRGDLFVALAGERFDAHDYLAAAADAGAWGAVVRRGDPRLDAVRGRLHLFEVEDTLAALGDLARLHRDRFADLPVVAVTGSNGKTTTKELLAAALGAAAGEGLKTQGNLNNLVGVPLTLFGLTAAHRWAVIEMGMNASGEIARLTEIARPQVGVVTGAGPVHLEGLGTVDAVARAKAELYRGLPAGAVAVVNVDDPRMVREAAALGEGLRRIGFGTDGAADVRLGEVRTTPEGELSFDVAFSEALGGGAASIALPLVGRHNAANACAALAAVAALGLPLAAAAEGLAAAQTVGRRLRRVPAKSGALILDDCYNANLLSMEAALSTAGELARARGGRVFAALGDMLELGAEEAALHRALGERAAAAGLAGLVAFGPRSALTAEAARHALGERLLHTEDPAAAADRLAAAGPADVILVKGSRGMAMERIVDRLAGKGASA